MGDSRIYAYNNHNLVDKIIFNPSPTYSQCKQSFGFNSKLNSYIHSIKNQRHQIFPNKFCFDSPLSCSIDMDYQNRLDKSKMADCSKKKNLNSLPYKRHHNLNELDSHYHQHSYYGEGIDKPSCNDQPNHHYRRRRSERSRSILKRLSHMKKSFKIKNYHLERLPNYSKKSSKGFQRDNTLNTSPCSHRYYSKYKNSRGHRYQKSYSIVSHKDPSSQHSKYQYRYFDVKNTLKNRTSINSRDSTRMSQRSRFPSHLKDYKSYSNYNSKRYKPNIYYHKYTNQRKDRYRSGDCPMYRHYRHNYDDRRCSYSVKSYLGSEKNRKKNTKYCSHVNTSISKSHKKNDDIIHFNWAPGIKLNRHYIVRSQLGEGTFGRVLECKDIRQNRTVAIKVVRDVSRHTAAAKIEAETLKTIKDADIYGNSNCVLLIDHFFHDTRSKKFSRSKSTYKDSYKKSISHYRRNRNYSKNYDKKIASNSSGSSSHYGKGVHMCLAFEKLGLSLFSFLVKNNYCGFFIQDIQMISYEVLKALSFLREIKLTHTDLKPENILLVNNSFHRVPFPRSKYSPRFWDGNVSNSNLSESYAYSYESSYSGSRFNHSQNNYSESNINYSRRNSRNDLIIVKRPSNCKVKLIDFGSSTFEDEEHSKVINTRQYRAPEVILQIGWSMPSDMWCFGCILFELYTGIVLFCTHERLEHLAMIEKIIGPFPQHFLAQAAKTNMRRYINYSTKRNQFELKWPKMASSYNSVKRVDRCRKLTDSILPCHSLFLDFLKCLLVLDPNKRITPSEALKHPFLHTRIAEA